MAKDKCCKGACKVAKDKSIYNSRNAAGKGDQPRSTTKAYEENYESIFPNAFKPKWQLETEKPEKPDTKKNCKRG
jgi:hypothetical protein